MPEKIVENSITFLVKKADDEVNIENKKWKINLSKVIVINNTYQLVIDGKINSVVSVENGTYSTYLKFSTTRNNTICYSLTFSNLKRYPCNNWSNLTEITTLEFTTSSDSTIRTVLIAGLNDYCKTNLIITIFVFCILVVSILVLGILVYKKYVFNPRQCRIPQNYYELSKLEVSSQDFLEKNRRTYSESTLMSF